MGNFREVVISTGYQGSDLNTYDIDRDGDLDIIGESEGFPGTVFWLNPQDPAIPDHFDLDTPRHESIVAGDSAVLTWEQTFDNEGDHFESCAI